MATTNFRSLFQSSKGRYVLGPECAQQGDLICILFGGDVPFILRRMHDTEAERYMLVGEAYVDGAMDGQIMREYRKCKYTAQMFELV